MKNRIGEVGTILGRNRIVVSLLIGGAFWFLSKPTFLSIAVGVPFVLLGEAIRIWSSGYIRKNEELATTGPYALTRNPLYLGNGIMGFGFVLMGRDLSLIFFFFVFFTLIYRSTIQREEARLSAKFGERFAEYVAAVPRFPPLDRLEKVRNRFRLETGAEAPRASDLVGDPSSFAADDL
ncbi:MAG: isoprenylcysteine carboxylmethyltransferase family protein [Candidatus Manganitrophus sp.]|nr:MAG: isoprenylcysteine carboxylmethyltransferase family protein [Candidatus Manganitrophus sp.]